MVLYSATGALMAADWSLVSWTALHAEPLTRDAQATARVRRGARNANFAIAFYTACAIVAIWLPLAIALVITVMWLHWVIFGIRSARDSRSD